MKRAMAMGLVVVVLMMAAALPVFADDPLPIYYVKGTYKGECQDGSLQCPFPNAEAAIAAGQRQICEDNKFEVHVWNDAQEKYERKFVETGARQLPKPGTPLSRSAVILMVGLLGVLFVLLALRLRRSSAR